MRAEVAPASSDSDVVDREGEYDDLVLAAVSAARHHEHVAADVSGTRVPATRLT